MNISSLSGAIASRTYETASFPGATFADAPGAVGELEAEQDPLGGMAKDGPIDKLNDARNGTLEVPGLGKAGRELGEDSALGGLSRALGRDILSEGEALGRGDTGMNLPGLSAQDRLGDAIGRAAGALGEGNSGGPRGAAYGAVVGCVIGLALTKALPGCEAGAVLGGLAGGVIGTQLGKSSSKGDGANAKDSSREPADRSTDGSHKSKDRSATTCDPLTQCCPGTGGMGDDQEGRATAGDPIMNNIELSRRAKNGDGKAATVLSARGGNAADLVPAWTRNSDAREGQGKAHHDGDAVRKGIGQVASRLEREDGAEPGGVVPPHSFAKSVAARAANPVIQPLPM